MVVIKNDCVGCVLPCIDCGRKRVPHLCCDACGDTVESVNVLQYYEEYQLCDECFKELVESHTQKYTLEELIENV